MEHKEFEIIVIGGGHAGLEAAMAASQLSDSVALISLPGVGVASAPCNPCIGGVGKGQVVREIDALGGIMGKLADFAGIQYRTLNESKGFAVQSTRVQIDKELYSQKAEELLESSPIEFIKDQISSIQLKETHYHISGNQGWSYGTKALVVTVGTFLDGKLHIGSDITEGGRSGVNASGSLTDIFKDIKKIPARFKTGTPPRLHKDSIDYSVLEEQPSDGDVVNFHWSHRTNERIIRQVSCYLARTNNRTLKTIRDNKELSPMYNGQIKAVGARYCPSIEDKAYRYPDKDIHHVFIEPEGLELKTMYPSGISSSLPREIQEEFVQSIQGLEKAEILEFGYAVEYDVVDTTQLKHTLEHESFENLYFAGQVNGTSGYEEAAGQGIVAGFNAALKLLCREPLVLSRRDSYIGVMIEDLISNKRDEPYRLFTARNENRLYVREDNAIQRMWSYRTSLEISSEVDSYQEAYLESCTILSQFCDQHKINRNDEIFTGYLRDFHSFSHNMAIKDILKSPKFDPIESLKHILKIYEFGFDDLVIRHIAIEKKYQDYIQRAKEQYKKVAKLDVMNINWSKIIESENISFECKQRIQEIKPKTFGQLKLIEGIRPATLAAVAGQAF